MSKARVRGQGFQLGREELAPAAADRVALTVRFLNGGLAHWERDGQADADGAASLAPFTLTLTDLGVAMLDAPNSVPPHRELVPR